MRGSGIMLRRLNDALPGLVLGIIVYGAAVFLAGIWFVPDKLRFTTGLAIGIALACGMAVNMAVVLRDAVEIYGEAKARSKIIARSITRYLVVVIVFFVMMKWELGSLPLHIDSFQSLEEEVMCLRTAEKMKLYKEVKL